MPDRRLPSRRSTSASRLHKRCAGEQDSVDEMKKYLVQLKRMVPTIPHKRKVKRLELLQHVIDYIQMLELTLQRPDAIYQAVSPLPAGRLDAGAENS
ncbi:unnamed protein product [Protopolystoma xenopodis]|uniref:BHLH domain-containing protein n=1 Tax=Protopolystoma xenopodis TaxID=117903 RepID=A0A3S4ZSY1_9PLAT|nr:unnamed protein product [Protopolystoma xenopodis]